MITIRYRYIIKLYNQKQGILVTLYQFQALAKQRLTWSHDMVFEQNISYRNKQKNQATFAIQTFPHSLQISYWHHLPDCPFMVPWVGSLVAPPSRSLRLVVVTSREARELVTLRFFNSNMDVASVDIVRKRTLGVLYKKK